MPRSRLPLNVKLALLVCAVGLPMSGILAWSTHALFRSELARAEQHAVSIANAMATRAEVTVERTRTLLKEIAKRPSVQAMDRSRCDPLLTELRQILPVYANINVLNARWEFVCSARFSNPDIVVPSSNPQVYEKMKAIDDVVLSPPVQGRLTGKLVLFAAHPVKDVAGALVGAVAAPIDLAALAHAVAGPALPAHGLTRLISGDGYIITSYPDLERIGKLATGVASAGLARTAGISIEDGADGIERVYAYAPVRGTDWIASAATPTAWAFAEYRRLRNKTLASLFLVLALAGLLTHLLARRISRPLRELQQDAGLLATGRLAHRSKVATQDEVGQLAAAFNTMAQTLETQDAEYQNAAQELRESHARLESLTRRQIDVQEGERRAIARELHDEVGGVLTAVKLNLLALQGKRASAAGDAAFADSLALVGGAIQTVRSISHDLRPAVLDDLGLIPALKWYCGRQAQRAGIAIELALEAIDLQCAPQLESACFRIAQESLTNALRHAHPRRIRVALRLTDGGFVLEIADDGGGFDVARALRRGQSGESSGLLGMEERTKLLGGRLTIDSTPGAGTRVRVAFAMPEGGFA